MTIGLWFSLGCIHAAMYQELYIMDLLATLKYSRQCPLNQMCLVIGTEENKIETLIKTMNVLLL